MASSGRFAALGLFAGGCTGWLGWGVAQILIPGLPSMGCTPLQAGALSLCTLAGITSGSSLKFFESGQADIARALALGVPAVVCAPIGAVAAGRVAGRTLQIVFNTLTVIVMPAQALYFARKIQQQNAAAAAGGEGVDTPSRLPPPSSLAGLAPLPPPPSALESTKHAVFGGVLGFGSGFLGVAGLPFVVTWFAATSALSHQQCVGTTFLACTPAVVVGSAAHMWSGNVPMAVLGPLTLGSLSGCYLGAAAHLATPVSVLQGALAASFVLAGGRGALHLRRLLLAGK